MKRFLRPFVFVLLAIYNAICIVTGGASLKKLAPTGVINSGILGGFSGKVGPVVGGKWKDIDYMRSYVIPANPNTAAQQAVRTKFSNLVALARNILPQILQPYWEPFQSSMSGFNAWISKNYALTDSAGAIQDGVIMSEGTLEDAPIYGCTYDTATGEVAIDFNVTVHGNGLSTDLIVMLAYDQENDVFWFGSPGDTRNDSGSTVTLPTGLTATSVFGWLFFTRGTGSDLIVSDSIGGVCTAA